jgi:excisionase family DNA binding protein
MEKEFLTVRDVAGCLGTTIARTYQLVALRRIPHVRRGRTILVPRAALDRWLRLQTEEALLTVADKGLPDDSTRKTAAPSLGGTASERPR